MDETFDTVLADAQEAWMDLDGVVAVGEGSRDGRPSIAVFVSSRTDDVDRQIPASFRGFPVEVQESGEISAE